MAWGNGRQPSTHGGVEVEQQAHIDAIDQWLGGGKPFEDAMSAWHQERDARVSAMSEFTSQMATLAPPPPEMQHLLEAVSHNQHAMDDFVSVIAGMISPSVFFSEDNIGRILSGKRRSGARGDRTS